MSISRKISKYKTDDAKLLIHFIYSFIYHKEFSQMKTLTQVSDTSFTELK